MKKIFLFAFVAISFNSISQTKPSWNGNQFTINWQNPIEILVRDTFQQKELAYLRYDTIANTTIRRGNQNYVYFGLWHEYMAFYEIAIAADDVTTQINDDGTVKSWPLLSNALDRYKAIKLKYWRYFPLICNCQ